MGQQHFKDRKGLVALLAEGVDRNPLPLPHRSWRCTSPSSRRAWIEILQKYRCLAPHTSPSSRRAWIEIDKRRDYRVPAPVALLAEGVDRNGWPPALETVKTGSPSSRRAWIEMEITMSTCSLVFVALLAEGVDRNKKKPAEKTSTSGRPPRGGRG